ncbi:hypothetical protein EG68_10607 [Paragonimus skrjabini miyazakii]|uniref:CSN8/PSMD8/EIF3K domain-containing protein n=1 Tax=Paragonimus skrjabini miyazakii TaxID=59628 RepID=A0A8S9YB45_9TREM|nr:hypothetical protein EG68_10607 [Paragonimus skrjabini miyazakii]
MCSDDTVLDQQLAELEFYELTYGTSILESKCFDPHSAIPTPEEFYVQFLCLYVLKMDLLSAKFLWQRIPSTVKETSRNLIALWKLIQCLLKRDMASFFKSVDLLLKDTSCSESLTFMVRQINEKRKQHLVTLMKTAYSCVLVEFVSGFLNMSRNDAIQLMTSYGWRLCPQKQYLLSPANSVEEQKLIDIPQPTNEEIMSKLAEFMCFIENH